MYLAIDWGQKRIGLALGSVIPKGAGVIDAAKPLPEIFSQIKEICGQNEVEKIIIGLPYRSRGEEGTLSSKIKEFGQKLHDFAEIEVVFEPEEFTTSEAKYRLDEAGLKYDRKSGLVDQTAAEILLEQYIERQSK